MLPAIVTNIICIPTILSTTIHVMFWFKKSKNHEIKIEKENKY